MVATSSSLAGSVLEKMVDSALPAGAKLPELMGCRPEVVAHAKPAILQISIKRVRLSCSFWFPYWACIHDRNCRVHCHEVAAIVESRHCLATPRRCLYGISKGLNIIQDLAMNADSHTVLLAKVCDRCSYSLEVEDTCKEERVHKHEMKALPNCAILVIYADASYHL